jgi:hypothetical protein
LRKYQLEPPNQGRIRLDIRQQCPKEGADAEHDGIPTYWGYDGKLELSGYNSRPKGKSLAQLRGRVPHDLQDQPKTQLVMDALES